MTIYMLSQQKRASAYEIDVEAPNGECHHRDGIGMRACMMRDSIEKTATTHIIYSGDS